MGRWSQGGWQGGHQAGWQARVVRVMVGAMLEVAAHGQGNAEGAVEAVGARTHSVLMDAEYIWFDFLPSAFRAAPAVACAILVSLTLAARSM